MMIVRNEARCIERCLRSVSPWVDEMVVLYTGSTDDTVRLARACGAQVQLAEWADDFAAARNVALALAGADWRLVLDADEWIAEGAQALDALRSEPAVWIGQVCVTSLTDGTGAGESPSWLPRLLPREVRYTGRIHEQPDSSLPRRRVPLVIGHDGYLAAQRATKHARNERLLRMALAERPQDAYLHYQLGKDLELRGQFEAAEPHYAQALRDGDARAAWRHDLVLRTLFTRNKLARFEAAMALAEAEMPHWQQSPDFHFALADLLLGWAASEPARAAELLPMIEAGWHKALEIGERPDLHDTVHGRGSYLAAHNLAVLHTSLGRTAEGQAWAEQARQMRSAHRPLAVPQRN